MNMPDETIEKLRTLGDILVCWRSKDFDGLNIMGFNNKEDVAEYLKTSPYFIKQVLEGKTTKGSLWKPNIFYKNIDEEYQHRYIVVYTEDWINYSYRMRENRIIKLRE